MTNLVFFSVPLRMHRLNIVMLHCSDYSYWRSNCPILASGHFLGLYLSPVVMALTVFDNFSLLDIMRCSRRILYISWCRRGISPFSKDPWDFLVTNLQTTVWTLWMLIALDWSLIVGLYCGRTRKYTSVKHFLAHKLLMLLSVHIWDCRCLLSLIYLPLLSSATLTILAFRTSGMIGWYH